MTSLYIWCLSKSMRRTTSAGFLSFYLSGLSDYIRSFSKMHSVFQCKFPSVVGDDTNAQTVDWVMDSKLLFPKMKQSSTQCWLKCECFFSPSFHSAVSTGIIPFKSPKSETTVPTAEGYTPLECTIHFEFSGFAIFLGKGVSANPNGSGSGWPS